MFRWLSCRPGPGQAPEQHYFDALISTDLVDDLLTWLSDPQGTRARWEANRWDTLCSRCLTDYGFDPARDGELSGAEQLGRQAKPIWKAAWQRYSAAPARYPGLVELGLLTATRPPTGTLFDFCPRRLLAPGQRGRGRSPLRQARSIWPRSRSPQRARRYCTWSSATACGASGSGPACSAHPGLRHCTPLPPWQR